MKCKIFFAILFASLMMLGNTGVVLAKDTPNYGIEFVDDTMLDGAVEVNKEVLNTDDGKITVITTYILPDGGIVTDTFTKSAVAALSNSGSDTVTRTRTYKDFFEVTLTASFEWGKSDGFQWVECTSADGEVIQLRSDINIVEESVSHDEGRIKLGAAYAKIRYNVHKYPHQNKEGTLTIKCTDSGTISDS